MRPGPLVETALSLYPSWWKERHLEEMRLVVADLLQEGRSPLSLFFNLLREALRTRAKATGMPKVYDLWVARTRHSIAIATLSWWFIAPLIICASVVSSLPLERFTTFLPSPSLLFQSRQALLGPGTLKAFGLAVSLGSGAGIVLFLLYLLASAVLVSGWISMLSAINRSDLPDRRRLLWIGWVPAISLLGCSGLSWAWWAARPTSFMTYPRRFPTNGNIAIAHVLGIAFWPTLIIGWLVSLVCIAYVANRADLSLHNLRTGQVISAVVALLTTLVCLAYSAWIGSFLFLGAKGLPVSLTYPHEALWIAILVALVLLTGASIVSAFAARRAWLMASSIGRASSERATLSTRS
jgi:hypothetical protein